MKVLDLFSGIGGFSLGLEAAGMETVAFCEIEKYPCKVLAKNWPNIPTYNDVRELTYDRLKKDGIGTIDVICGGFPCQDISVAGNQAGIEDGTRSGLWSECARLLGEIRPKYAIFENVTALLNGGGGDWFKRVLYDISTVGYDAEWHCIPASELGAHHHRDRIWIIAYPNSQSESIKSLDACKGVGLPTDHNSVANGEQYVNESSRNNSNGKDKTLADTDVQRQEGDEKAGNAKEVRPRLHEQFKRLLDGNEPRAWATEPQLGRVANGIPDRSHRLKGLGNAVVPQIPELIGKAIMEDN